MNYKLHYGNINNRKNINELEFKTLNEMMFKVQEIVIGNHKEEKKVVYLLSIEEEIFITENIAFIIDAFCRNIASINISKDESVYLFEEESYESCYAIALDMREENPLCYDKQIDFTLN